MAYPSDTHNRIIYMLTIFFPSHAITVTSKIELAAGTDRYTHVTDIYSYFLELFTIFLPLFFGFA